MERPLAVQQRCSQVPAGPRSAWVYLSPMDPSCSPQDALLSYLNYCKFFPYSLCRWATRWVQQRKSQLTKGVRKARKTLLSEKKKPSLHSVPSHMLLSQVTNHPMEAEKPATMKETTALSHHSPLPLLRQLKF